MSNARIKAAALAVAFGCVAATTASAALVYDTLTVYDPSDAVFASLTVTEAEQAADPSMIDYLPGVPVDVSEFGNYGVVLEGSVPVDIFGIAVDGPDPYDLAFAPGAVAQTYTVQNPVPDTGLPIDMTMYLDPALQADGYTAFFSASGNFIISVPEPATWAIMLVGVGLLGATLRGRRKAPAARA
jgi:hypothetical protein